MSLSDEDKWFADYIETQLSLEEDEEPQLGPGCNKEKNAANTVEWDVFSEVPPEVLRGILKHLSPEDLVSCCVTCKSLNSAASDESLWRHLYCIRWSLTPTTRNLRECSWKKLYIEHDKKEMNEFARNCAADCKEYFIQMQAAKRSVAPLPSQMLEDQIILNNPALEQVSQWKKSNGLPNKIVTGHVCSGTKCSYHQIGDMFICKETGNVHECNDNCMEVILSPKSGQFLCPVTGQCADYLDDTNVFNEEESDNSEEETAWVHICHSYLSLDTV